MINFRRSLIVLGLIVAILVWNMIASYALGEEIGVTSNSILLGTVADSTGPLALNGIQLTLGARVYFQEVNEQGGIHGRKIDIIQETDDYQVGKHIAALRKMIYVDKVFGFLNNIGSSALVASMPLLMQEKIPLVAPQGPGYVRKIPPERYLFDYYPTYFVHGQLLIEYAVQALKVNEGTIGMIYQDDDFGHRTKDGILAQIKKYSEKKFKVVADESYKRGATDLSSQVIKVRSANPDILLLSCVQGPLASIYKEAQKLNWKPKMIATFAAEVLNTLELAKDAADGAIFERTFYTTAEDQYSGVREYKKKLNKYFPGQEPNTYGLCGWGIARIVGEGLKRAGKDLTREKFVDALETIKDLDTLAGPIITYTKDRHAGPVDAAFYSRAVSKGQGKMCDLVEDRSWIYLK